MRGSYFFHHDGFAALSLVAVVSVVAVCFAIAGFFLLPVRTETWMRLGRNIFVSHPVSLKRDRG